jgi:hypothetical protein
METSVTTVAGVAYPPRPRPCARDTHASHGSERYAQAPACEAERERPPTNVRARSHVRVGDEARLACRNALTYVAGVRDARMLSAGEIQSVGRRYES